MKRYLCVLLLVSSLSFALTPVTINSASINYTTHTLSVVGSGFCTGALPAVTFNTTRLTVPSGCSPSVVVASLPVQAAGSYRLIVANSGGASATFYLTYGAVGPQGATGPVGPKGATGLTGATGLQGVKGATGLTGATGAQGIAGPQGLTGATGATGTAGAVGATGAQGPQGSTGAAGATGATGAQGLVGTTGAQGIQGLQGLAGANGNNGNDGAQGPQGPQGVQGTAGTNGAGFNFTGQWSSSHSYNVNDVATFNGTSYIATTVNTNAEPDTALVSGEANAQFSFYDARTGTMTWTLPLSPTTTNSPGMQCYNNSFSPAYSQFILFNVPGTINGNPTTFPNINFLGSLILAGTPYAEDYLTGEYTAASGDICTPTFVPGTYSNLTQFTADGPGPSNSSLTITVTGPMVWNVIAQAGAPGAASTIPGPQGPIGLSVTGATGPQGLTGLTGATGLQGSQGLQGPTGSAGANGNDGAQGPIGPAGPAGTNGTNGTGINWTGPWSGSTSYNVNDAASYNGTSYVAVASNTNQEPDMSAGGGSTNFSLSFNSISFSVPSNSTFIPFTNNGTGFTLGGVTGSWTNPNNGVVFAIPGGTSLTFWQSGGPACPTGTTVLSATLASQSSYSNTVTVCGTSPLFTGSLSSPVFPAGNYSLDVAGAYPFNSGAWVTGNLVVTPPPVGNPNWSILAAAGSNGAAGAMGPQGPSGLSVTGPQGPTGLSGPTGAAGPQGPQGPAGATGPAGVAGTNGTGFNFRGTFDPNASYAVNDVVTFAYTGNNITYNVNLTFGSGSAVGTITTDGTIGVLTPSNIVNWNLTLNDGTKTGVLTPSNTTISGTGLSATPTNLLFDYSTWGTQFSLGSSVGSFCLTDYTNCFPGGTGLGTWSVGGDNLYSFANASGVQPIATGGAAANHGMSTYVATGSVATGTAIPGTSPWVMMAQAGAPGTPGTPGVAGATGPQGPIGLSVQGPSGPQGPQGLQGGAGPVGPLPTWWYTTVNSAVPITGTSLASPTYVIDYSMPNSGSYWSQTTLTFSNTNSSAVTVECVVAYTNGSSVMPPSEVTVPGANNSFPGSATLSASSLNTGSSSTGVIDECFVADGSGNAVIATGGMLTTTYIGGMTYLP